MIRDNLIKFCLQTPAPYNPIPYNKCRPNPCNVSVGDKLIMPTREGLTSLVIKEVLPWHIIANNGSFETQMIVPYNEAIVRKKRSGEYLFGKDVHDELFGEGFGGIRVLMDY